MQGQPLDDAQVSAILARERAAAVGKKASATPAADTVPAIQAQAKATTENVDAYYRQVLAVLNSLDFPVEVASSYSDVVLKYYPSDRDIYILKVAGTTRDRWNDVPVGVRARALPALSRLWDEAKRCALVDAANLEASLAKFRAQGGLDDAV